MFPVFSPLCLLNKPDVSEFRACLFQLLHYRYYSYDLEQPFIPQYHKNMAALIRFLQRRLGEVGEMYALEQRTGRRWMRCAVCGNRSLLERVRAGQPQPKNWRVVFISHTIQGAAKIFARTA